MVKEFHKGLFLISTDKTKLDLRLIHDFLRQSYWAKNILYEKVEKSIEHSLCFGIYEGDRQIGFARVITDFARIAHLADVFVLQAYRGRGLGQWLMACIMSFPDLQTIDKWTLQTKDAHDFYRKYQFQALSSPQDYMEKRNEPL